MARPHDRPSGSHAAASVTGLAREASAAPGPLGFDPLSDVLQTVRLTGALFFLVEASDPWGIEVPAADRYAGIVMPGAQHVVSYHVMLEGTGWVQDARARARRGSPPATCSSSPTPIPTRC